MNYRHYPTVEARKKAQAEVEATLKKDLAFSAVSNSKKVKKKTPDELFQMIDLEDLTTYILRPRNEYKPKSYNVDKQIVGLINHLFVKYPIPYFMYQTLLPRKETNIRGEERAIFKRWFITLAQGGSFPKAVKGIMTRQEAAVFLNAPASNSVSENVWWAKLTAAGIPQNVATHLYGKLFRQFNWKEPLVAHDEAIRFFALHHTELDNITFGEITDFLAYKFREEPTFSLQGRTVGSVLRMSNEWHILIQKAKLGADVSWAGMGYQPWMYVDNNILWEISELRNNKELMNEGRKQKHCVYSYVSSCAAGRSAIFSMRGYFRLDEIVDESGNMVYDKSVENTRITIEVSPQRRSIVQVRGASNRLADNFEKNIIKMWSGEKGLVYSKLA